MEKWLPVVGYEGQYEISDKGRVRSVSRIVSFERLGKTVHRKKVGREIKQFSNTFGYKRFSVPPKGKTKILSTSRSVLEAFVGPCPDGLECCHRDGDKSNNSLDNLRWGTSASNESDKPTHPGVWVSDWAIRILRRVGNRASETELARLFKMSPQTVYRIQHYISHKNK